MCPGEHRDMWGRRLVEVRAFVIQRFKKSGPYFDLVEENLRSLRTGYL